jgi:hypothetical protein
MFPSHTRDLPQICVGDLEGFGSLTNGGIANPECLCENDISLLHPARIAARRVSLCGLGWEHCSRAVLAVTVLFGWMKDERSDQAAQWAGY